MCSNELPEGWVAPFLQGDVYIVLLHTVKVRWVYKGPEIHVVHPKTSL